MRTSDTVNHQTLIDMHAPERRFHHETLFYTGDDGFLAGALPFLMDAIAAGEPALVAVGEKRIDSLKEALGTGAAQVRFADMELLGRNPARIIPAWQRFLEDTAQDGRSVRGIGEPIWPGRSAAELTECQRHESLLNVAFDDGPEWRLLCPYDLDGLDERVIDAARRSHPFIAEDGASRPSSEYVPSRTAPGPFVGALEPPPAGARQLAFTGEDLSVMRLLLAQWALDFHLDAERIEQLVLAVNELASNSVRHGGGGGEVWMWREADTLLVDVHDHGYICDPLAGRIHPAPHQSAGRGLWLVNQLCDLVQIRSTPTECLVRLRMQVD